MRSANEEGPPEETSQVWGDRKQENHGRLVSWTSSRKQTRVSEGGNKLLLYGIERPDEVKPKVAMGAT